MKKSIIIILLVMLSGIVTAENLSYIIMDQESVSYIGVSQNTKFLIVSKEIDPISLQLVAIIEDSAKFMLNDVELELFEGQQVNYDINKNNRTDVVLTITNVKPESLDLEINNLEYNYTTAKWGDNEKKAIALVIAMIGLVYIYLYRGRKPKK